MLIRLFVLLGFLLFAVHNLILTDAVAMNLLFDILLVIGVIVYAILIVFNVIIPFTLACIYVYRLSAFETYEWSDLTKGLHKLCLILTSTVVILFTVIKLCTTLSFPHHDEDYAMHIFPFIAIVFFPFHIDRKVDKCVLLFCCLLLLTSMCIMIQHLFV